MSELFPIYVAAIRSDGTTEKVRIGTAEREGEGFTVKIGELLIGGTPLAQPAARPASSAGGGATVFPPYGRSKGMPIQGASMQDLEFYANGARRTLSDPGKARFHDKERALLAIIEAEIARQGGSSGGSRGGGEDEPPPHGDEDQPF